eukprot:TRINITY_DN67467_c7_g1_i1.p1 TRINITY_DN67467_c7_g1~~TRINITY_DN67467_c7_g1_i1.p1  ORF type:complete len:277 (-),score=31.91 TRINITY_DN67467_c7_g1_i1:171-1001(-)
MGDVVLITGCSTGLGREFALQMHAQKYRVFATARRPESVKDLKDKGIGIVICDVNDPDSVKAAVQEVISQVGRIDILINNAGISAVGPIGAIPVDEVKRVLDTNVVGLITVTQAVTPIMMEKKSGTIVNISSLAGFVGLPFNGIYSASKAAVNVISDALRLELKPFGIDVVVVCPGYVKSSINENRDASLAAWTANALWKPYLKYFTTYPQEKRMDTTQWVSEVLKMLEKKPRYLLHGPKAFLIKWVARWAPYFLLDKILARGQSLHLPLKTVMGE